MPVLGSKIFTLTENMSIDDDEDDDKQSLAAVKQKYLSQSSCSVNSKSPEKSPSGTPKRTPRTVVARPPTSHGSKKKGPNVNRKQKAPVVVLGDSSSSDDEVVLSEIAHTQQTKAEATTPKKAFSNSRSGYQTPKRKTPTKTKSPAAVRQSPANPFSPNSARERRFRTFCSKLAKLWANIKSQEQPNKKGRKEYNDYTKLIVSSLQRSEIERIPDADIRADILKRHESHVDKKKMKNMSEEEKRQYLKEKYAAQREQQKQRQQDKKKRYEDTTLDAPALPQPKPVQIPDAFSPSEFGDILMVTNFIRSYSTLLTPKGEVRLMPDEFANALVDSEGGRPYLAKILMILLHAFIHDEEAAFRSEMGIKLTDVELNTSTVGELVRLCLRRQRMDGEEDDESKWSGYASNSFDTADDELLEEISEHDYWDLSPSTKLKVLVAVSNRLLASVAVDNYFMDIYQQYCEVVMERNSANHEFNKLVKENKQECEEMNQSKPSQQAVRDDEEDIASKVKKRRLMAEERAKREAEEQAQEAKRREKDKNEYKIRCRLDAAAKKLEEMVALKRLVSRVESLGTDRDHNRYWFFGKWLPMIYVEKGWSAMDDDDMLDEGEPRPDPFMETTFPKRGPNEWYMYEKVEDVENLINALCIRGVRESSLKERLLVSCNEIKSIKESSANSFSTVAIKDYTPPMDDFKAKLLQLETSVRMGGLGGLGDFETWKTLLETSTTLTDMIERLLEMSVSVRPTLLCGLLAPDSQQGTTEEGNDGSKLSTGMHRWRETVGLCESWSRLHVLLSMLRSCIRWDRSVEHAKCRICRKKQDNELALVCDICNDIYHTYCLRPPLKKPPVGEWYCISCKPRSVPRAHKDLRPKVTVVEDEEESNRTDSEQHQENGSMYTGNCVVCDQGEFEDQSDELISCSTCSNSFHLNCHSPPLRHTPRGSWRCSQCVSGRQIRSTRLRNKVERTGYKSVNTTSTTAASVSLFNSDLYDDEASSAADSSSVASDHPRKRSD